MLPAARRPRQTPSRQINTQARQTDSERAMLPRHTAQTPLAPTRSVAGCSQSDLSVHTGTCKSLLAGTLRPPQLARAIAAGPSQGQDTSWLVGCSGGVGRGCGGRSCVPPIQRHRVWRLVAELGKRFLFPSTSYHKSELCRLN